MASPPPLSPTPRRWRPAGQPSAVVETLNQLADDSQNPMSPDQEFLSPLGTPAVVDGAVELAANVTGDSLNRRYDSLYAGLEAFGASFDAAPAASTGQDPPPPLAPTPSVPLPANPPDAKSTAPSPKPVPPPAETTPPSAAITAPTTPLPPSPAKARPSKQWTPKPAATPTKNNTRASELIRMFESKNDSPAAPSYDRRPAGAVATPFREASTASKPASSPSKPATTTTTSSSPRPRSPISSVQKMVASWRARNAATQDESSSSSTSTQPSQLWRKRSWNVSIRRRRRNEADEKVAEHVPEEVPELRPETPRPSPISEATDEALPLPAGPRTLTGEVSAADVRSSPQPLRTGNLFYFNVHEGVAPEDYTWVATDARLYPDGLELVWRTAGGGKATVVLDLEYCEEVASTYSPHNPGADDLGAQAARKRGDEFARGLYPFKLVYEDGTERLACDSALERVRWVKAIWAALENSRSNARPTPSVYSRLSRSSHDSGSQSTRYSAVQVARETTDDAVISTAGGLAAPLASRGSRRLAASPLARARSLRKVASESDLTDVSSQSGDTPLPASSRASSRNPSAKWKNPQSFGTAAELLAPSGEATALGSDIFSPPQPPFHTPSTAPQTFYSPALTGTRSLLSPATFHSAGVSPASEPLSFQTPATAPTSFGTPAAASTAPLVTSPQVTLASVASPLPSSESRAAFSTATSNTPHTAPSQISPSSVPGILSPAPTAQATAAAPSEAVSPTPASQTVLFPPTYTTTTTQTSRPPTPKAASLVTGTPRSAASGFTLRTALQNVAPPSESDAALPAVMPSPATALSTEQSSLPLSSGSSTATRGETHAPEPTRYQLYDPPVPPSPSKASTRAPSSIGTRPESVVRTDATRDAPAVSSASSSAGARSVARTDVTHDLVAAVDAAIGEYAPEAESSSDHRASTPKASHISAADPVTPKRSSLHFGPTTPRSSYAAATAESRSAYYSLPSPSTRDAAPSRSASSSEDKENFATPSVMSSPFGYSGHMPVRSSAPSVASEPAFVPHYAAPITQASPPLRSMDNNYDPRRPAQPTSRTFQSAVPGSPSGKYTSAPSVSSYESAPPVPISKSAYSTPSELSSPSAYSSAPPPPISKSSRWSGRRSRMSTMPPSNRSGTPVSEPDLDNALVFGLERHSSAGSTYSPDPTPAPRPPQDESRYTTAHEYSLYASGESGAFTTATAGASRYISASDAPSFASPPYPLSSTIPTPTSSYLETIPETLGPVPHSSASTFEDTTRARRFASPYQPSKSASSVASPESLGSVPLSYRPPPVSTYMTTVPESIGTVPHSGRPPPISTYISTAPESIGTVPSPRKAWTPSPLSVSTVARTIPETLGPVPSSRNSWVAPTPKSTPASTHSRLSSTIESTRPESLGPAPPSLRAPPSTPQPIYRPPPSTLESTRPESLGPPPPSLRAPPPSVSTPQSIYGSSRVHRKPVPLLDPPPPIREEPAPPSPPPPPPSSSESTVTRSTSSSSSTATVVDYRTLRLLNYLEGQDKVRNTQYTRIGHQLDRIESKQDRADRSLKHLDKLNQLDQLRKLEKLDLLNRLGELEKLDRLDDLPPPVPSKDSIAAESPPPSPSTSVSTLSDTERPVTPPAVIIPESFNQRVEDMGTLLGMVMGQQKDILEELAFRRELDTQEPSRIEHMFGEILRHIETMGYPKPLAPLPRKRPASSTAWSNAEGNFYPGSRSVYSDQFGAPVPPNTAHSGTSLLSRIPESLLEDGTPEYEFDDEHEIDNLPPASPPRERQQYRAPAPDAVTRQRYALPEYDGEVEDETAEETNELPAPAPAPQRPVPYRQPQADREVEEDAVYEDEPPERRQPRPRPPPPEPVELPTPVNSERRKLRDADAAPGPAGPQSRFGRPPRGSMPRFGRPRSPLSTTYVHPRYRPPPLGPYPPPGMMPMMPPMRPGMPGFGLRPGYFTPPGFGPYGPGGPGMYRPHLPSDTGIGTTTTASSSLSPPPPSSTKGSTFNPGTLSVHASHHHTPAPSSSSDSGSRAEPQTPVPAITIKVTPASIEESRSASDGVPSVAPGSPSVAAESVPPPSASVRTAFSQPLSTSSTHRMLGNTEALGEAIGEQQNDIARYLHGMSDQIHDVHGTSLGLSRDLRDVLVKLDALRKDRPERVHGHVLPDGTVQLSTGEIVDGIQGAPPPVPVAVVPPPPDSPAVLVGRVLPDGTVMAGDKIVVGIQGVPRDPTPEELAEEAQRAKDLEQDRVIDELAAQATNTKETTKETKETKEVTNNTTTIIKETDHDKEHDHTVHEHVHSPRTELLSPHLPPIPAPPTRGHLIREEVEEFIRRPDNGGPATRTITRTQTYTEGSIPPIPRLSDSDSSHHSHAGTPRPQDESQHGRTHHGGTHHSGTHHGGSHHSGTHHGSSHHGGTQHGGTQHSSHSKHTSTHQPSHAGTLRPQSAYGDPGSSKTQASGKPKPPPKVWSTNPVRESRMGSVAGTVQHNLGNEPDNESVNKVLGWRPSVSGDPANFPLPASEIDPDGAHFPGDGHSQAPSALKPGRRPVPSIASTAGSKKKDLPDMPLLTTRTKIVPSVADPAEAPEVDAGDENNDPVREGPPIVPEVPDSRKVKGSDKNTRFSHTLHPFHRSARSQPGSEVDDRPLRVLGDSATEPEPENKLTKPKPDEKEDDASKQADVASKATEPSNGKDMEDSAHNEPKAPTPPTSSTPPKAPDSAKNTRPSTNVARAAEPQDEPEMVEIPVYQPITLPDGTKALIPMGTATVPSARPTPSPSGASTPAPSSGKGKAATTAPPASEGEKAPAGKEKSEGSGANSAAKDDKPSDPAPLHEYHNVATEKLTKPQAPNDHPAPPEKTSASPPKDASPPKEPSGASKPPAEGGKPDAGSAKQPAGDVADDAPPPVPKPPKALPRPPTESSGAKPASPEPEKEPWQIASPAATLPPPAEVAPAPSINKIKRKPVGSVKDDAPPQTLGDKATVDAPPVEKAPPAGSAGEKDSAPKDKPLPPSISGSSSGPPGSDKPKQPDSDMPKPHREPPPPLGPNPPAADPPGHIYCHCERCCTNPPRADWGEKTSTGAPTAEAAAKEHAPKPAGPKEPASKEPAAKEAASKDSAAKDSASKEPAAKDTPPKDLPAPPKTPAPSMHIPLSHQTAPTHPDHPTFSPVPFPDVTGPYANVPFPKPTPPPADDASKKTQAGKDGEAAGAEEKDKAAKKPETKEPAVPKAPSAGSKKGKGKEADGGMDESEKDKGDDSSPEEKTLEDASSKSPAKKKSDAGKSATEAPDKEQPSKEDEEKKLAADRHKEFMDGLSGVQKALDTLIGDNKAWRTVYDEHEKAAETRRTEKAARDTKFQEALDKILANDEELKTLREAEAKKPGTQAVLDAFKTANDGQATFLRKMGTEIMDQNSNQHKLTQEASDKSAREKVAFNISGYLDDFSKKLATEVRLLITEVGNLGETRRAMYVEMSDLLLQKARLSSSGILGIIPYPPVMGIKGPAPPKKDEKKDGKDGPKDGGKPKGPPGPPAWSSFMPPGGPAMGMAPMPMHGRPLPATPGMMPMGPAPMPFMPGGHYADPYGGGYPIMQMPQPIPTGPKATPEPDAS
ncbi:hypothetical protein Q8F55_003573 [Vanrija albida]|uniref:PH domain-containing protein n=1 Tax=Vanrija albida TaxID=181172 RepID=A0ABR3Q544_9TREE